MIPPTLSDRSLFGDLLFLCNYYYTLGPTTKGVSRVSVTKTVTNKEQRRIDSTTTREESISSQNVEGSREEVVNGKGKEGDGNFDKDEKNNDNFKV